MFLSMSNDPPFEEGRSPGSLEPNELNVDTFSQSCPLRA